MNERNWVDEVLRDASKTVREWPAWMLRPEVRAPENLAVASVQQFAEQGRVQEKGSKERDVQEV